VSDSRLLVVGGRGDIATAFRQAIGDRALYAGSSCEFPDIKVDLSNPNVDWDRALKNITHCLVASGVSRPSDCMGDESRAWQVNVQATENLLEQCKRKRIIPIFLSSEQVYGDKNGLVDEEVVGSRLSIYAKQKIFIEKTIRRGFSQYIIFRLSRIEYSENRRTSLLSACRDQLLRGARVAAYDQMINLLHVDDFIALVELVMGRDIYGTFNVAGGEWFSRSVLLEMVRQRLVHLKVLSDGEAIAGCRLSEFSGPVNGSPYRMLDCRKLFDLTPEFRPRSAMSILTSFDFRGGLEC
jgi:nucleoside-diphosphate-sugar epimerase